MHPITKKRDVYTIVTTRIIEELEKGSVPWKGPWSDAGIPQNLVSKRAYRGINLWHLLSLNYPKNYFLSFRQILSLEGRVKKGEKAHLVVFWKWVEKQTQDQKDDGYLIPLLRYHMVFNVDQCENLPDYHFPVNDKPNNPIQSCESIVTEMPKRPRIQHSEQSAYYYPFFDIVNMPRIETFVDSESYYGTLFHELIHSTGHETRLNRKELIQMSSFGSETYSIEELTAELGACYLKSYAGISQRNEGNNVAYLKGWLEKLKNDMQFIFYASAHAQRATDYILNVTEPE